MATKHLGKGKGRKMTNTGEDYTSSDYGNHLLQKFGEFRDEGLLCDFTLRVGKQTFKVHKMVLCGCSDYFRAMFTHGMLETKKNSIDLNTVSIAGLRPLLNFAYTGKMNLSVENISEILATATFLQIGPAIKLCCRFLKEKMTFENANKLMEMGHDYGLNELKEYHSKLVLGNFFEFVESPEFVTLDAKTLSDYLMSNSLRTTTEAKLLKCALKWYNHHPRGREAVIHTVMDKIRYTIDGWPTIEFATSVEPFKSNKKCKEILSWCHKYMQEASRRHLHPGYRTAVRYDKQSLVQMGGVKLYEPRSNMPFEFELDEGELEDNPEKSGCQRYMYYHSDLKNWIGCGVVDHADSRSHCPVVEVNDYGIMVGGYLYTSDFVRTHQHCSNEVKLFTPCPFSVWDLPYMQDPRTHHAAVHTPGYIYAIAGKKETGPMATVDRFDLDKEKWSYVCSLESSLWDHAAASHEDKVYVSGGVIKREVVPTVWCYTPDIDSWDEVPSMLTARAGHTMTRMGNQLIVCGGRNSIDRPRCLSSVETFSLELQQWTFLTPMRLDCQSMASTVLEGKLLVCGGENTVGDLLDQIQEYDPEAKKWTNKGVLPQPLKNLGIVAVTVKLTKTGEDDTDSLLEEFNARHDEYSDEGEDYFFDSDEDEYVDGGMEPLDGAGGHLPEDEDFQEWRFFVPRQHWPV